MRAILINGSIRTREIPYQGQELEVENLGLAKVVCLLTTSIASTMVIRLEVQSQEFDFNYQQELKVFTDNFEEDFNLVEKVRLLANSISCELCLKKSGSNILDDGSCRHNQNLTHQEIFKRLSAAVNYFVENQVL